MLSSLFATLSIICTMLAVFTAAGGVQADTRKVGGLRFVKLGRLTVSYSVSRVGTAASSEPHSRPS